MLKLIKTIHGRSKSSDSHLSQLGKAYYMHSLANMNFKVTSYTFLRLDIKEDVNKKGLAPLILLGLLTIVKNYCPIE